MLQNILTQQNATAQKKITVNAALSAGLIALAVILPQIVHLALGPDVPACADRRLSARMEMGACRRHPVAGGELCDHLSDR